VLFFEVPTNSAAQMKSLLEVAKRDLDEAAMQFSNTEQPVTSGAC